MRAHAQEGLGFAVSGGMRRWAAPGHGARRLVGGQYVDKAALLAPAEGAGREGPVDVLVQCVAVPLGQHKQLHTSTARISATAAVIRVLEVNVNL